MLIISEVSPSLVSALENSLTCCFMSTSSILLSECCGKYHGIFPLNTFLQALQLPPRKTGSMVVPVLSSEAQLFFSRLGFIL